MASTRILITAGQGFGRDSSRSTTKKYKSKGQPKNSQAKVVFCALALPTLSDSLIFRLPDIMQIIEKAIDLAERSNHRASETSLQSQQGVVDYVKVKDWGTGQREEVGELALSGSLQQLTADAPLFDRLARQLETLESQGALTVARLPGSPSLPPFLRWAFAEAHYQQYLHDLLCVHEALEIAYRRISRAIDPSVKGSDPRSRLQHVGSALLFLPMHDLARSEAIRYDLRQLQSTATQAVRGLQASPNARAYAQFLDQLATQWERAEQDKEMIDVALRLLAHVYINILTLLTSGVRITAAAVEKLDLFRRDALRTHRGYPGHVNSPLSTLRAAINEIGGFLEDEQEDALAAELPNAIRRTSLVLEALAREDGL